MPLEAKEIFEAESKAVRTLLSEPGVGFYIPPYQRPYSWAKDKVERLLDDTLHGFRKLIDSDESFTFLGTIITIHDRDFKTIQPIVKPDVPAKVLNVIDGQQRITTLLLECIALHNKINFEHAKFLKSLRGATPSPQDPLGWLDGQILQILAALKDTFVQVQPHGTARKYPRMIRAFHDQWSRDKLNAKYISPIANLISTYCEQIDLEKPSEFKPKSRDGRIEGEDDLVDRYSQIAKILKKIYLRDLSEDIEEFPSLSQILDKSSFQKALLNHEFPSEVVETLRNGNATEIFQGLLRLVLFGFYVLDRVAVTVVRGKNEDYAFSVFESLNTTGEPLTAFETFRPRVVSAEGLDKYEGSDARLYIDQVADYLLEFNAGEPLQNATSDLLVVFASAETGEKLSKRLSDQRRYLKDEYERYEQNKVARLDFVRHLRDTSLFLQHAWVGKEKMPNLHNLPIQASSDVVKLCLAFLKEAGHTITVGPLVRYYSVALAVSSQDQLPKCLEFEEALKAITAFSVLWRASHRGTANIDQEYRDIMLGNNGLSGIRPLSRSLRKDAGAGAPQPAVDIKSLKKELRERLKSPEHGNVADKEVWINQSMPIPTYTNSKLVTRFILLAAYHDSVEDSSDPGLIIQGKTGVSPCLTFEGWRDEKHLSLEHIAPRERVDGWNSRLYDNRELIHQLGNLVLVPTEANSSLSNRPWKQKSILYATLGAKTKHDARIILENAKKEGVEFAQTTEDLVDISDYMPHLSALGDSSISEWDPLMIEKRSKRILQLAWERLWPWLS